MHWIKREALLLAVLGGFGLLVLPALVYKVGELLLGEYRPGAGIDAFYTDLFGHLGTLSPWAWLLVTGPWLAVQTLRLLWLPLRPLLGRREEQAERRREDAPPERHPKRIEPTI